MSAFIIKRDAKLYTRSKVLWVKRRSETSEARCPVHTDEELSKVDVEPDDYRYFCPLCEIERLRTERDAAVEKAEQLQLVLGSLPSKIAESLWKLASQADECDNETMVAIEHQRITIDKCIQSAINVIKAAEAACDAANEKAERLRDGLKALVAELADYAPGGTANLGEDDWSGVGIADLAGLRKRLVALLEGEAPAATGQGR